MLVIACDVDVTPRSWIDLESDLFILVDEQRLWRDDYRCAPVLPAGISSSGLVSVPESNVISLADNPFRHKPLLVGS